MSVILKALRAQNDEGGSAESFQVDKTDPPPQEGGPGSRNRQIILLILLLLAIVLYVVLQFWGGKSVPQAPAPAPAPPPIVAAPVAPKPAAVVPVAPVDAGVLQIARSQYKSGEYDESLKSFQKAVDQDPNNAAIHNDMGLVLLKKELYASAEGHFAKALELDDSCAECYNNLGYLKTALDQPVEAEKYLQRAIVLKPDYADPYFNLAVMYEKNGDVGKAVESYQDFLQKIPKTETELATKIKSRIHDLSGE